MKPASSRLEWKADGTETTSFGAGLPLPLNTEEAFIGRRQFEVICEKACLFVPSTAVFLRKLILFVIVFFWRSRHLISSRAESVYFVFLSIAPFRGLISSRLGGVYALLVMYFVFI